MSDDAGVPYPSGVSPRRLAAAALLGLAGALPLLAVALGQDWYLDGPLLVLLALAAGYAAGAWLPRAAAVLGAGLTVGALVLANQLHGADYHPIDDLVFFLAIVGGPAAAGAAVSLRAAQVDRLERLQAELTAQQEIEVLAARLEEQSRVEQASMRGSPSASRPSRSMPRVRSAPATLMR